VHQGRYHVESSHVAGGVSSAKRELPRLVRTAQAKYFHGLLARHHMSAREVARQSRLIAQDLGDSKLAFGHSAVCYWLSGLRNPSLSHRRVLAAIFHTTLDEISVGCDEPIVENAALTSYIVYVSSRDQQYEYRMAIKSGLDLSRPAVYRHWSEMFRTSKSIARHFSGCKYSMYGWIPDASVGSHRARSLVPIRDDNLVLDRITSTRDRVWFVYLPGGKLDCGIAFQDKHSLVLFKYGSSFLIRYPLSRVDLVGYGAGNTLFHILPSGR